MLALQGGAIAQDPPRFLGVVSITAPSGTYGSLNYYQDIHGATQINRLFGDPNAFLINVNSISGRGTGN
ncbi:MAG TPA: hypothetical protein VL128_03775 [Candidatus Eisenbacteria bacterium]|nr:hypothetical protein [Candidatus Eisenbacteria bacterium]